MIMSDSTNTTTATIETEHTPDMADAARKLYPQLRAYPSGVVAEQIRRHGVAGESVLVRADGTEKCKLQAFVDAGLNAQVEAWRVNHGMSRSDAVRTLVQAGLAWHVSEAERDSEPRVPKPKRSPKRKPKTATPTT